MDGDEIELNKEELQRWIRDEVKNTQLVSPDVLEKCRQLQSLLQRREEQAASLLKLCKFVAACEETVKKLYFLLGWEYRDTDSDDGDDDNQSSCDTENPESALKKNSPQTLRSKAVVVLTKLPASQLIKDISPPSPQNQSEDESLSCADSDMLWESDSSDPDYSVSSFNFCSKKRKKTNQKNEQRLKIHASQQMSRNSNGNGAKASTPTANTESGAESGAMKTSLPRISANSNAKHIVAKTSEQQASAIDEATHKTAKSPQANKDTGAESKTEKTSAASTKGATSVPTVSTVFKPSAAENPLKAPQEEIILNMKVLAMKKPLNWEHGTIVEIIKKEDGKLKYKVSFDTKGRSLVSGHHIAFDCTPRVDKLFIGARVVVKSKDGKFLPGIMAELPSRKNRMRFLVFLDDHTPVYVSLPLLYLVCTPLEDPLNDICDEKHRNFMKDYLKSWPYPHMTKFKTGQTINIECNGYLQKTEIERVDCSLIEVVFLHDQHKEWIYQGSMRLEQIMIKNKWNLQKEEGKRE